MNILDHANKAAMEVLSIIDHPETEIDRQAVKVRAASTLVGSARAQISAKIHKVEIAKSPPEQE